MSPGSDFPLPVPPQAFPEDASLSSLGSFLFDVWQLPCPVTFPRDILWLTGRSHGETAMEVNCWAGAHEAQLWGGRCGHGCSGSRLTCSTP